MGRCEEAALTPYLLHLCLFVLQQLLSPLVRLADQGSHLAVDEASRGLAVGLLQNHLPLPGEVKGHLSHLWVHPELHDLQHTGAESRRLLDHQDVADPPPTSPRRPRPGTKPAPVRK